MDGYVLLLNRLLDTDPYDPNCTRLDTALKAVWLLYLRKKWELLESMGLSLQEFGPLFERFKTEFFLGEHYRLRGEEQAMKLVQFVYRNSHRSSVRLLVSCFWMIAQYRAVKGYPRRVLPGLNDDERN